MAGPVAKAHAPLAPGRIVARRFLIERLVGSGGMGQLYRSRDLRSGAPVALKLLHRSGRDADAAGRLEQEARLLTQVPHPGIPSYVAHGRTRAARLYLVMEWIDGGDLAERLRAGPLPVRECLSLLRTLAQVLAVLHARAIVHGDLKPRNILLRHGQLRGAVLADFGVARGGPADTHRGARAGTPGYLAPEGILGSTGLGPGSDIFSLGCVLYECLSGRPPFAATDVSLRLMRTLFEEPPLLFSLRGDVPPAVQRLLLRMLTKDPAQRLPDALALARELAVLEAADRP